MGRGERNEDEAQEGKIESGGLHLRSHVHTIYLPSGLDLHLDLDLERLVC